MEYLLGGLVVVAVLAFVVLPLLRRHDSNGVVHPTIDPSNERAEIYRQLLELELDQKVGKIAEADYREISDAMLARAATLISQEDAESLTADAAVEREIAAAREALRHGTPKPVEETRA